MKKYPIEYSTKKMRVGIVWSRFTEEIGVKLLDSCIEQLRDLGVKDKNITVASVPGALEIPVALQNLALSSSFNALIAIGVVIRGETYHFELVSNESAAGISRVALDFNLPIANAVLTTENDEQAIVRAETKGREAAKVAIECATLIRAMENQSYIEDTL
ncbi:MAG: 6,7-dimethyl-8-ribityllumazine synthase [Neisseriaceae bacterium]|nr:6,7-dimethyl-8-ribityllumazine synthase [Neisseriaceae bacterium]